jgi:8-amino-3,8-dideoxy-alpha-D-manno-octulosonate transaminase
VPEGGEENYSFVNFFLPNEELTKKAHKSLSDHGVDANFYWYTNNWHYINGWEHLRNVKSLGSLSGSVRHQLEKLNNTDFSKSDAIMSRTISSLVKVGWSEEEVILRAEKMRAAIAAIF